MSCSLPPWTKSPFLWGILWGLWFGVLWYLSDGPIPAKITPDGFLFSDKLAHFGYFFGGAGLLSAFLYKSFFEKRAKWTLLILIVFLVGTATGILDEWHQSWVPERSGNDPFDLLADMIGTLAGAFTFWKLHPLLSDSPQD